jgi:hypothetical protein
MLIACSLVVLGTLPALAGPGGPGGGNPGGQGGANKVCEPEALAEAQEIVDEACDCEAMPNHGRYVSCAAHALRDAVRNGEVPKACKRLVRRGAARSTCGKTGFVACCMPDGDGAPTCGIKREAKCQAPACASPRPSCLDACTETGCASSPSGAFVSAQ